MKAPKKRAFDIKDVLVNLARMKLPGAMGHRYTDIVVSCLVSTRLTILWAMRMISWTQMAYLLECNLLRRYDKHIVHQYSKFPR